MDPNPSIGKDNLMSKNPVVTTHTLTLLDLSTEVLVEILAYLPAVRLFSVQRTCRTIRDIIAGTTYFQYTMRAFINGVDDFLPPDFPHSERLELLRRHEQSWNSLQLDTFTQYDEVRATGDVPFSCPFIIQDGFLIYECLTGGLRRYGYVDLCSASASRDEELSWVHVTMADASGYLPTPSTVVVFAVDHDLMVATRYCLASDLIIESLTSHSKWRKDIRAAVVQLSFFQFTTGAPHPLSSTHTVSLPQYSRQPFTYISQEVLGDHVLVTTYSFDSKKAALHLVSWKTGAVTLVSSSSK
jgi:hypothetical protein